MRSPDLHNLFMSFIRISTLSLMAALAGAPLALHQVQDFAPGTSEFTVSEFAVGGPTRLTGGDARLNLGNVGVFAHHLQVVRLDSARTVRDFERALVMTGQLPRWAVQVGQSIFIEPGERRTVQLLLSPGPHLLLCIARFTDGSWMLMKGMYHAFAVVPPALFPSSPPQP